MERKSPHLWQGLLEYEDGLADELAAFLEEEETPSLPLKGGSLAEEDRLVLHGALGQHLGGRLRRRAAYVQTGRIEVGLGIEGEGQQSARQEREKTLHYF